jgi:ubiquinone/menaquinone biosynthesis C-methylase UbiE
MGRLSSWYQRGLAPYIVHAGCSADAFSRMRRHLVPRAEGVVVEVGFGSGLNLPYYDPARVMRLVGVDPDATMLALARRREGEVRFPLDCLQACGESIPLPDGCADTVLVTYTLCTIPDPEAALAEIRRILKPGGRLIFAEHGQSERALSRRWQDRLNPLWSVLAGGCHLNREPLRLLREAGFEVQEGQRERFPAPFWLLGTHHSGVALRLPDRLTADLRVTKDAGLISSPNQQETIR